MMVTVLLFATLKDRAGVNRFPLTLPDGATLKDLRQTLAASYPALAESLPSAVAAINQEFAFDTEAVSEGDEVAFFPPVSGGQAWPEVYRVAHEPIDLNA